MIRGYAYMAYPLIFQNDHTVNERRFYSKIQQIDIKNTISQTIIRKYEIFSVYLQQEVENVSPFYKSNMLNGFRDMVSLRRK